MNSTENQKPVSDEYYDAKGGSAYIQVSPRHFLRLKSRGLFPSVRLSPHCVRYRRSDLDRMMARLAVGK